MELIIGAAAALFAALFWASATVLYSQAGSYLNAAQLNLVKGLVACPLLIIAGALTQQLTQFDGSTAAWLLLASGVIGITLGDTLYFTSLNRIGPWRTMLLEYLAPPFAAVIAWVWLGETLTTMTLLAAVIILCGLMIVIIERRPSHATASNLRVSGLVAGGGAAFCQAVGLVMAFEALASFEVSALNAALLRLSAGTIALTLALLLLKPKIFTQTRAALRHTSIPWLMVAIVMGTFAAIWLQQLSIAYINPGLAQTLLATAPLWLIPIQAYQGQTPSRQSLLGATIAVSGILILFW